MLQKFLRSTLQLQQYQPNVSAEIPRIGGRPSWCGPLSQPQHTRLRLGTLLELWVYWDEFLSLPQFTSRSPISFMQQQHKQWHLMRLCRLTWGAGPNSVSELWWRWRPGPSSRVTNLIPSMCSQRRSGPPGYSGNTCGSSSSWPAPFGPSRNYPLLSMQRCGYSCAFTPQTYLFWLFSRLWLKIFTHLHFTVNHRRNTSYKSTRMHSCQCLLSLSSS